MPFAAVYFFLLYQFPDSIAVYSNFSWDYWGGIETLFMLNSGILGWLAVVILERRTGATGFVIWLLAVACCFVAIGGGFGLAAMRIGPLSDGMWDMLAFSLVAGVITCAIRVRFSDIF